MLSNRMFFNSLSVQYDEMIGFEKSLEKRTKLLHAFVNQETKSAADLGCGSGIDSLAFANLGLSVTGFDQSKEMVEIAKKNAKKYSAEIEFIHSPIEKINAAFHNKFDLVISLGNTFANISSKNLIAVLTKVRSILKPGGRLLLQILNYDLILKKQERIVSITASGDKQFIRFCDFTGDKMFFNVLSFQKITFSNRRLITTEIFPHTHLKLLQLLSEAGFQKIESLGSMKRDSFDIEHSKDLVIFAA